MSGPVVVWEVESCDSCGRAYPVSHLSAVVLADSTSELRCGECVDELRLEVLSGGAS